MKRFYHSFCPPILSTFKNYEDMEVKFQVLGEEISPEFSFSPIWAEDICKRISQRRYTRVRYAFYLPFIGWKVLAVYDKGDCVFHHSQFGTLESRSDTLVGEIINVADKLPDFDESPSF